ncbi:hypothetical protein [Intestinimonas timonensis]|uniref:hypothetical protein n=1 Tax=Intestinimonas timonensis TaxID=1689270 RepID=UPI001031E935|nr:hypothetical protein [Intestinimonas timonensis]
MKGLWNSAKWELRESGLLNWKVLLFLGFWAIYDLVSARSWGSVAMTGHLSFHLIVFAILAVCQGLRWPFTGSFDLERTSDRPAWQSLLGRTLAWAAVIAVGSALQQASLWIHLEWFKALYPQIFSDGAEQVARLEAWTGGAGFLTALLLGMGLYVLSITVALCCKSGKKRHRATLSTAAVMTILTGLLLWFFLRSLPLGFVGLGVILTGLTASIWLLTYKVE